MNYPDFFDTVASIKVKDPLAQILGVFENGEYEIPYLEVVKAAGHSCPTVAGAYAGKGDHARPAEKEIVGPRRRWRLSGKRFAGRRYLALRRLRKELRCP